MITNEIKKITDETFELPLIIRSDEEGWIPTFDLWTTKIYEDTSYIESIQNFRAKLMDYSTKEINQRIGYYDGTNLVIYWKTLVDTIDLVKINKIYNGKLRACSWQKRYCTYFGIRSDMPWLHTAILECDKLDYVIHHINGVSLDNRRRNLHILPKREHDSINHPSLDERKIMFANPKEYWQKRKELAINEFITQLSLIITENGRNDFIAKFAKENLTLTKEILEIAKIYINLSSIKSSVSENRILNSHLDNDYLDAYEIEKYLKKEFPKNKIIEGQLKLI